MAGCSSARPHSRDALCGVWPSLTGTGGLLDKINLQVNINLEVK
jgi:hypothetical protein